MQLQQKTKLINAAAAKTKLINATATKTKLINATATLSQADQCDCNIKPG